MAEKDLLKRIEELEKENNKLRKENEKLKEINSSLISKKISVQNQINGMGGGPNKTNTNVVKVNVKKTYKRTHKPVTTYTEANAKNNFKICKKDRTK